MNHFNLTPTLRVMIIAASFVIIVAGVQAATPLLIPFLLAMLFAVIFWPILDGLQKRGLSTAVALTLVILGVVVVSLIFMGLLAASLSSFSSNLPVYQMQLTQQVEALSQMLSQFGVERGQLRALLQREDTNPFRIYLFILSGLSQLLTQSFMILFYVIFILVEVAVFQDKLRVVLKGNDKAYRYAVRVFSSLKDFLVIKTYINVITGIAVAVPLWLLGIDFAFFWGFLAFLLNYVPYIGSIIAGIPAVVLAFIEFGPGSVVLLVIGIFVLVNIIVGYVLEPKMLGEGLGLSALVVFITMVFWGWVLGPVGLILSTPVTAAIKIVLESSEATRWAAVMLGTEADVKSMEEVSIPGT
ncbi:MAG: AI-2E family transporter [Anaerolineae bacterium]|nr:AI-2E family transporter [Anaerolineae bacterium]